MTKHVRGQKNSCNLTLFVKKLDFRIAFSLAAIGALLIIKLQLSILSVVSLSAALFVLHGETLKDIKGGRCAEGAVRGVVRGAV